ncbi:hypothetical protein OVX87_04205 [Klebsiella pneumoniae]|nr:hypothetical protein [Klebsiella pneumoniae]MCY0627630.1 hypothetical protein [Klebsiella pneumoniae]
MNTYEMLSISITSPAWEAAVDFSSSVESAIASQNRLVKEALNVWEHRQNSETGQVTFQLIVFTRTGEASLHTSRNLRLSALAAALWCH